MRIVKEKVKVDGRLGEKITLRIVSGKRKGDFVVYEK